MGKSCVFWLLDRVQPRNVSYDKYHILKGVHADCVVGLGLCCS